MLYQLYQEIDLFTKLLEDNGHYQYAADVREAKLAGSMSSEVIGLVSLELKKASKKLGRGHDNLIAIADKLLEEIDRVDRSRF